MIEQQGRVVGLSPGRVRVALGAMAGCSACDAGRGCGAGVFGRLLRRGPVELDLPWAGALEEGASVRVGISESAYLGLVFRLYGAPLLAGLVAGALCHHVFLSYGIGGGPRDAGTLAAIVLGAGGVLKWTRRTTGGLAVEAVTLLGPAGGAACGSASRRDDAEEGVL